MFKKPNQKSKEGKPPIKLHSISVSNRDVQQYLKMTEPSTLQQPLTYKEKESLYSIKLPQNSLSSSSHHSKNSSTKTGSIKIIKREDYTRILDCTELREDSDEEKSSVKKKPTPPRVFTLPSRRSSNSDSPPFYEDSYSDYNILTDSIIEGERGYYDTPPQQQDNRDKQVYQINQHSQKRFELLNLPFTQLSNKINENNYVFIPVDQLVKKAPENRNTRYPLRNRIPVMMSWCESVEREKGEIKGIWTKRYNK